MDAFDLKERVEREVATYAGKQFNAVGYLLTDDDHKVFTIVDIGTFGKKPFTTMTLLVHVEDTFVVIYYDGNSLPLVDALVEKGVPREQIILAYAGEAIPEKAPATQ